MRPFILQITAFLCAFLCANAFTVPSKSITVGNAARSSLFRSSPCPINKQTHYHTLTVPLQMTEANDDEVSKGDSEASTPAASEVADPANETPEPEKERSGFINGLVLGSLLLFKFGIVLVVKFLTDLVVFPLLYMFRISKVAKNKVNGLFGKDDLMNGDKVNGSS